MGIWARASTRDRLLEGLAKALFSAMTDRRAIRGRETRTVTVTGADGTGLAVAFLSDLLVLFHTEGFLLRTVRVRVTGGPVLTLRAELSGEPFDSDRHPRRVEVKAITYHAAVFDPRKRRARIVVDI
jgi:SHS2 domain-containing protein